MSSTLQTALREHFTSQVRTRGQDYLDKGRVHDLHRMMCGLGTDVRGTRVYGVRVLWVEFEERITCTLYCPCVAFEQSGPCKHLWATILYADQREVGPPSWFEGPVDILEGMPIPDHTPKPAGGSVRREHLNWKHRVRQLVGTKPDSLSHWGSEAPSPRELRYYLDPDIALQARSISFQVREHSRKKNGEWGVGKMYSIGSQSSGGNVHGPDDEILEALLEASRSGYSYDRYDRGAYDLRPSEYARLLPLMASTGRLYLGVDDRTALGPILLDQQTPWMFCPTLVKDTPREEMCLSGSFLRDGESLAVYEPSLILAKGVLLANDCLMYYEPESALHAINTLRTAGDLLAPLEAEEELVQALLETPGFSVDSYADLEIEEGHVELCHLSVEPRAVHAKDRSLLACSMTVMYNGVEQDIFAQGELIPRGLVGAYVRRDTEAEIEALELFLECGGQRVSGYRDKNSARVAVRDLEQLVIKLLQAGWMVTAEGQEWRTAGQSSFSVKSGVDWFDLEGKVEFGGEQYLAVTEMLNAARSGSKIVQLGDGSVGVLPERWLESWGLLGLAGQPEGDALRFKRNQGWLLDALLAQRDDVNVDQGFSAYRGSLASFAGVGSKKATKGFCGELRTYQEQGLGWFEFLRKLNFGGCLADDMGLGKTVQVLAMLESRRVRRNHKDGLDRPSLVVAPRSVVFNWLREAAKFTPKLRVIDYTGADRKKGLDSGWADEVDLVLTTYGTLRRDILDLRELEFDYVILDEAQAIKNPGSQSAKSARLLNAQNRLALSGTPIENHLGELWSLFEFLNPGMLGASKTFKAFGGADTKHEAGDLARLSKAISPFFLRRTKREVLPELPEKTEQVLYCEQAGKEEKEYSDLRDFYRHSLKVKEGEVGLPKMKIQVLEALLRLRQSACHPGLMDKTRVEEESAKLDVLMPMLESVCAEGHKALVFSQFTSLLSIVRSRLDERGLVHEYLDGRARKREEKVDRFQEDPDCPLFLISIKAGGSGLNLTAADYVFLLDPWWNPAVEAQAIDRVHRIGRTKPVIAYRLITRGTVEEKVAELQEGKRQLADAILGSGRVGLRDLTREDLDALLE